MPAEHFEIAVVGGGKGGKTLAAKMASASRPVVMVEKGMIGGTCINVACIPTKTMVKSAKVAELARRAAAFGIRVALDGADPIGARDRKRAVVAEMVGRNQANFDRSGMTLLLGTARFTGPRSLEVRLGGGGVRELTADKVFVNTGTRPALPPMPGLADARPLHSESVQELDRLPELLIVLGGGYVGCEFAQMSGRRRRDGRPGLHQGERPARNNSARSLGAGRRERRAAIHPRFAGRLANRHREPGRGNRSTADRLVPYTLFIDPELGRVGMTEAEARRRGLRVRVARLPAAAVPRAVTAGETRGHLQAVVDADSGRILGASILAAEGGEVMAVIQVAMRAGLPSTALRDMVFAHPTMAEGLNDLFERLE